jgi:predicted PhzF superfamily epimerase YddE/YHI9
MNYNYYIADVFTKKVFNGAQVAVFPKADGLSKEQMTLVARELNPRNGYCFILQFLVKLSKKCV